MPSNSAALLRDTRTWFDWVRPGLLLYGIVPPPLASDVGLRPALSLTSRIVAVKGVRPGEGTGYGLRWRADGPGTIAIVPAGYADGLDTRLGGRGVVLVRGRRVPIVGAVSMDMIIDRRDRPRRLARRRRGAHRRAGGRVHYGARDRGGDWDDSVGSRVPVGKQDREKIRDKLEVQSQKLEGPRLTSTANGLSGAQSVRSFFTVAVRIAMIWLHSRGVRLWMSPARADRYR